MTEHEHRYVAVVEKHISLMSLTQLLWWNTGLKTTRMIGEITVSIIYQ